MKFILDDSNSGHAIQNYGAFEITISGKKYRESLVIMPDRIIPEWRPARFQELKQEDFAHLASLTPEIIVLGTGSKQHFPDHQLIRPLLEHQIGLEVMATDAACRTYNILMSEGRRVAAALMMIGE
ncbi:MAG: Mth938-like domain-containing protein [Candidatus Thiodiazotropha weberae]|nr:Mth938-like domain-containing protein [Candidatus Thiodiazotropha lotti]MCG8011281.1 Mth938-like domain-containing protein [Candidatus Thiodiazotropha lotti]MCG8020767.1 Mth938-like domain-containing protein [Candidatus Thiodiazotropha lotti]MCW4207931.1 Mth938-like domain-containing protein [Candidatus Thiodiazotropha lotti]MCW4210744.1 Mth938-like domain-containing protein [Candidatus Thiodiazotropha lotti]